MRNIGLIREAFPNGCLKIWTSTAGFLCGFEAVSLSLRYQYNIHVSVAELQRHFHRASETMAKVFLSNDNNFSIDQLSVVLQSYCDEHLPDKQIQLGYLMETGDLVLLTHDPVEGREMLNVWIHNDADTRMAREGYRDFRAEAEQGAANKAAFGEAELRAAVQGLSRRDLENFIFEQARRNPEMGFLETWANYFGGFTKIVDNEPVRNHFSGFRARPV